MIIDCNCSTTSLPALGATRCGENMGQQQVLSFIKMSTLTDTVGASHVGVQAIHDLFASAAAVQAKDNWEAAGANVQISPEVKGWEQSGGDAVTWGEDVDPDGMPMEVRKNPVQINVTFRGVKQSVVQKLNELKCLAQMKDLGLNIFNTAGEVIGASNGASTPVPYPFSVEYLSVEARVIGNRDEPDSVVLHMWITAEEWDKMVKVTCAYSSGTTAAPWKGIDLLAVS